MKIEDKLRLELSAARAVIERMGKILDDAWIVLTPGETIRCDTKRFMRDQIERVRVKPKKKGRA